MSEHCVETVDLTHRFSRDETALSGVDLRVAEGAIYGFLGPNGAGKTTTLKLVLGLLRKQHGEIKVFGRPLGKDRREILRRVGSMIESPSVYAHLTAVENLEVLRMVYRCPARRIGEVLSLVGLAGTGRKKAGQFSLGMKQRLGIASALLHEPELLILDEPTNGLDPNGILEIRELLQTLNRTRGTTVLVSSHLLSEIERLVTHVGIIRRGSLVFQGAFADLMAEQQRTSFITFETSDAGRASEVIAGMGLAPRAEAGGLALPVLERELVAEINRRLVECGIDVYQIGTVKNNLEAVFFDLVGE